MFRTPSLKSCFILSCVTFMVLALCYVANAAGNEVDLSFNPVPSKDLLGTAGNLALQPDGKILIFGDFQIVNGVPKTRFARLNSDGTLDNSFNYNAADFANISSVVVQTDGKILVAGTSVNAGPRVARLNSDGSSDLSFTSPWSIGGMAFGATVYAAQADGKIFAALHQSGVHIAYTALYRLNSDGSIDNAFAPIGFDSWNFKDFLNELILLPGNQLLIGGKHGNDYVYRVNTNGSTDSSFESPLLTINSPFGAPSVSSIARQSDGKVLFTGTFATVNGITRTGLTRLNADGTLDLQFPQSGYFNDLRVLSNDKIIVGGYLRLNSDGTPDNTFNRPASLGNINKWLIDGSERILLFGTFTDIGGTTYKYARLNTDGSLDSSFNPLVRLTGVVNVMAMQPDSRTLVYGDFTQMNGVVRNNIARLDPDGALDPTFDAGSGFNLSVNSIVVQPNGKILLGGYVNLSRLEANGSVDAAFVPTIDNFVYSIAVQTDNKILIGGSFATVNGLTQKALARLNADGTTDTLFNPLFGSGSISAIVVQSNDKIIIGGTFAGVSGVARSNIARLNADGSVDTSFNAGSIQPVRSIVLQPDGKYLVLTDTVSRLNVNGSLDNTFQPPTLTTFAIKGLVLQSDGSVVVVGSFATLNGIVRPNLGRLSSNGQVDVGFLPGGANGSVNSVVMQPSGKVIIGGSFTSVNNIPRAAIARLTTVAYHRNVLFDYDGDGKADVSVYRSSNNYWYLSHSSDSQFTFHYFGAPGDIPTPADYDGDGKTDLGIFRPSSGDWWYQSSITGVFIGQHWGSNGDIPRPSDFDGDGRADYVVYHSANNRWYRLSSANGQTSERFFGAAGDKPIVGDFDGDGRSDPAIFRPSTGTFWYMSSIDSVHRAIPWGASTDIPAPADYDGDGKTDAAVYRPSTGFWYIYFSATGTYSFTQFGIAEDKPIPADYDGDGKADIAVYRPSTGTWYMLRSTAGFNAQQFGNSTDVPTPNAFVP